ncbi:CPBP family intramembrane metalloprotease [Enemella evansiae]|uniref:CPBP family intramembrane glutamic endopeptidase n=1 Tax=Enemella evansiae TaxID=2016499 RepID=UPI000B96D7FA|nr:CPBP family intramembrane glutamic endopeptidase [Enemella evansiae]OYO01545.1 CPBP family intramembrane metalloprotease [Enemella evansiae]
MLEFVLFCIPTLIYVLVVSRKPDETARSAFGRAGGTWGPASGYGWALAILPPLLLTAWLAIVLIPAEVLQTPGVTIARLTSVTAVIGVILRAVGEEVFFRGLLGGVLIRRLGFTLGNTVQAIIFLLPHLPLLLIDLRTWPILPVQFATGWLLGWLRNRTGSFVPGAIVHTVANVAAGLIVLL